MQKMCIFSDMHCLYLYPLLFLVTIENDYVLISLEHVDVKIRLVFLIEFFLQASEVACVYDQHDNCALELALAKNLWKIQVNRLLNGVQKPTLQGIQKHLKKVFTVD